MSEGIAQRFAAALQQMEETGDVELVTRLFSEDASLCSPERDVETQGQEGIREFWKSYLESFDSIRSEFRTVRESDGLCILEWESEATWKNGKKLNYRGASLLETDGQLVRRFATYYDTAALRDHKHHPSPR